MRRFSTFLFFVTFLFAGSTFLQAQLSSPEVAGVYGGRVNAIEILPLDSASIRIFVATESANSLFANDVEFKPESEPLSDGFLALPDANEDDNLGAGIRVMSADRRSHYLYFINNGTLYGINVDAGSRTEISTAGVQGVKAYNGRLFFLSGPNLSLHFGEIDSLSGSFTESADSPVEVVGAPAAAPNGIGLYINPNNNKVYVAWEGNPANIYTSSAVFDSLVASSSFSMVNTSGLGMYQYRAFGMGPDGRFFAGTSAGNGPNHSKFIAWTDDDGASWDTLSTGISGVASGSITCGYDSNYAVYFGSAYSDQKGAAGSWANIGWQSSETHPNDGTVAVAPFQPGLVMMTTDMGIGVSMDFGANIFEIDEGLEAVQVNDFDMNDAKTDAWLASKSGIRHVANYGTPEENWSVYFPNHDGSPYFSIAVDKQRPDTAFAGNVRLYRTFDGGVSWNQVFRTEDYWEGDLDFSSFVSDVIVHPDSSRFIALGVNSPSNGVKGAVFYSFDYGTTWNKVETGVYNTEVKRLAIDPVNADSFTVYVACDYVNDGTTSSYGVKKIGFRFSDQSVFFTNDMISETGGHITNFGASDIAIAADGRVVAAGGNSSNEPRVYGLAPDSSQWMAFSSEGFPLQNGASAVTWGFDAFSNDVPYVAVNNILYALDSSFAKWTTVYDYPQGSRINVLYWDDLLVGTGTGLYAQYLSTTGIADLKTAPGSFKLNVNYPNPFNPETIIEYHLGVNSMVELTIFDITGRKIRDLISGVRYAGTHSVTFNAGNLASGVYFYRMKARPVNGGRAFVQTHRMLLLK